MRGLNETDVPFCSLKNHLNFDHRLPCGGIRPTGEYEDANSAVPSSPNKRAIV